MNTKIIKKRGKNIVLWILTGGASLILGLLSFGGFFAIWPIVGLALTAFILSVAYEGEIFRQNIQAALKKLIQGNKAVELPLGKAFLLEHFPIIKIASEETPQFFKNYHQLLKDFHQTAHAKQRKRLKKQLQEMEQWFTQQLFSSKKASTDYAKEIAEWFKTHDITAWQHRLSVKKRWYAAAKVLSVAAGIFMAFGASYLLMEVFAVLPFLAAISSSILPVLIVPMAIIAGIAFSFQVYNAATDMIQHETVKKWFVDLRQSFKEGVTFKKLLLGIATVVLITLAALLTICTAGTWWAIAKHAKPLFGWMAKIPKFVTGTLIPAITGTAALIFNIQNTIESLAFIKETKLTNPWENIKNAWRNLKKKETTWQIFNPFRVLIKLTYTPLRILLFLGHIIGIGATADQTPLPGLSKKKSAILTGILGIISEGFEDLHYFFGHDHAHQHGDFDLRSALDQRLKPGASHHHNLDLPSRLLKFIFIPLFALAALWDWRASLRHSNSKKHLTFKEAFQRLQGEDTCQHETKKHGHSKHEDHDHKGHEHELDRAEHYELEDISLDKALENPKETVLQLNKREDLLNWNKEYTVSQIEHYKETHFKYGLFKKNVINDKIQILTQLQNQLSEMQTQDELEETLSQAKNNHTLNQHRFYKNETAQDQPTKTHLFLQELAGQVAGG